MQKWAEMMIQDDMIHYDVMMVDDNVQSCHTHEMLICLMYWAPIKYGKTQDL